VKKRSLLMIVAMLSVLLLGIGAAYAVTGVDDPVPGQDVIIPIICEGFQPNDPGGNPVGDPVFGSMNTIWAIAEVSSDTCVLDASVCVPKDMAGSYKLGVPGVARANVYVFDRLSERKLDLSECWSKHDVISNQCTDMITAMTASDRDAMEVTINNIPYFVGYVTYGQSTACNPKYPGVCISGDPGCSGAGAPQPVNGPAFVKNRFASWVYLNDISKGFVTGFDGVSVENGIGPNGLTETCTDGSCTGNDIGVTARTIFPRYYILNSDPDTYTWWILLLGRNEYHEEYLQGNVPENSISRWLNCYFCDENENCQSNDIRIPYELNILNVKNYIPGSVWPTGWPISDPAGKRGFAYCDINESGSFSGQLVTTTIAGTLSYDGIDLATTPNTWAETYSLFAWAYERAFPTGGTLEKLAVVHPIHRLYCAADSALPVSPVIGNGYELPSRFNNAGGNTVAACSMTGTQLTGVTP